MLDTYPLQSPRTAWRVYDGEAIVLCSDDSTLNSLNAVGTMIWESADGKTPISTIVTRICDEFEVDREQAEHDTLAFITRLRERGLLTLSETIEPAP